MRPWVARLAWLDNEVLGGWRPSPHRRVQERVAFVSLLGGASHVYSFSRSSAAAQKGAVGRAASVMHFCSTLDRALEHSRRERSRMEIAAVLNQLYILWLVVVLAVLEIIRLLLIEARGLEQFFQVFAW